MGWFKKDEKLLNDLLLKKKEEAKKLKEKNKKLDAKNKTGTVKK